MSEVFKRVVDSSMLNSADDIHVSDVRSNLKTAREDARGPLTPNTVLALWFHVYAAEAHARSLGSSRRTAAYLRQVAKTRTEVRRKIAWWLLDAATRAVVNDAHEEGRTAVVNKILDQHPPFELPQEPKPKPGRARRKAK